MKMYPALNLCTTCLSTDRLLTPLHSLKLFLQEINCGELKPSMGGICWECQSIIKKIHRFRLQVQNAQEILTKRMEQIQPLKSLTTLSSKLNITYDFEFHHTFDPLTTDADTKPEIKEESISNDDQISQDDDKIENVYVETIKKTEKSRCKRDVKGHENKFIMIMFTEEEMVRNREEKRNHPNYKKIPYKCDSCVLGFMRKETFDVHMEKKHDKSIGSNFCDVCHIRFSNLLAVQKHRRKHYISYKCKFCKHESQELWTAVNHAKSKHREDALEKIHCGQCEKIVKTPEELEKHLQTDHSLYCNECGVKFKGMNTLRRHKARIHTEKREFICDICTKTFMTKTRLECHMVSHNETIAKKLAYCHTCGVQYKNIYVYRNHLKYSANHSEKTYTCPKCDKVFASKMYKNIHYNFYHLKKSKYHCELCNKLFISYWRLKNHRQKHHGLTRTRDHPCNICGKKFFTISTLRGHQLTHSEQRSFMCEDCGDTFKQRPALYTHSRLVHSSRGRRI